MCTLPEPAKSITPIEREKRTFGSLVSQLMRKGDSQPCGQHLHRAQIGMPQHARKLFLVSCYEEACCVDLLAVRCECINSRAVWVGRSVRTSLDQTQCTTMG